MSIETRLNAINDHLVDDYSVLTLAGADLTNVDKNIVNLKPTWKERLLYFMNNGTDTVWNNWDKVNGSGTSITLNNTEYAPMKLEYGGNTSQTGTPTPDSPQTVHVVSGDNTITVSNGDNTQSQSYLISLGNTELCKIGTYQDLIRKSTGKNLFDSSQAQIGKAWNNASNSARAIVITKVNPSTTYQISYLDKSGVDGIYFFGRENENDSTLTMGTTEITTSPREIITTANTNYIGLQFNKTSITQNDIDKVCVQLEKGTSTSYEPYGTDWYLKKEIGKVVLTGSSNEDWSISNSGTSNWYYGCIFLNIDIITDSSTTNSLSDYYIRGLIGNSTTEQGYYVVKSAKQVRIRYGTEDTVSNWKTWLSTHNVSLYYVLATPTYTKITGTLKGQLEAIKRSYEEQTSISQSNNDLPFELSVSALEEIS